MNREGYRFLIPTLVISLVLFAVWALCCCLLALILAMAFFLLSLFVAFFFRDPERQVPPGENLIVSSADGKVIAITPFEQSDFIDGKGTLISVFMSVFSVHVNRAPVSGRVEFCEHHPGKFFPAFKEKASLENEQTRLGLQSEHGRIVVKQIAGIIARRIVCRIRPGDQLKRGERFGMIRFGSRVDLFLPENVELKVELNQKVKAGESILGAFRV
jgi:phosphatidylserine decarboxylase